MYDTLGFAGRKITIIPVLKDEGSQGDRDFLQWDTISLMSLLGVYAIVAYYADSERSSRYRHKITNQRFDIPYIEKTIRELLSYQSDALHWNMEHIAGIGDIGQTALERYAEMSARLDVDMHSAAAAARRIARIKQGRDAFAQLSRELAQTAQSRETLTLQPKERVSGTKASITIRNYLGGHYYLTLDEVEVAGGDVRLIEAKHSSRYVLPSSGDIKDALIKMALFTNLKSVEIGGVAYKPTPVMKLTSDAGFDPDGLSRDRRRFWETLTEREAKINRFLVEIGS